MSHYNARVSAEQQYQLVIECRGSGLTDYQWCKEHGIHPGTFYNWVSRLRKKACHDIPAPVSRDRHAPSATQEVVRLDFGTNTNAANELPSDPLSQTVISQQVTLTATIEISLGPAIIRIANGTEPAMLDRILCFVKGTLC